MAQKVTFAQMAQTIANVLAEKNNDMEDMVKAYFDRGYNTGGSNPIIDSDVASLNIKAADVSSFITLAQQINGFFANQVVAQADYQSTLSKLRTNI